MTSTTTSSLCICRCVGVDEQSLLAAIEDGASSLDDLKRRTRAGMGFCQGAYCRREMAALFSTATGVPLSSLRPMTMQPPAGGITLAALAAAVPPKERA